MPIPKELVNKIYEYEKLEYSANEIITGLAESKNYPSIARKIRGYREDGYRPEEILKGIKESPIDEVTSGKSSFIYPFRKIWEKYQERTERGLEPVKSFIKKPAGKKILPAIGGAIEYLTAPVEFLREPVEMPLREIGVPSAITKMAGEAVEMGAFMLPYGQMVRGAIKGTKAIELEESLRKGAAAVKATEKVIPKPPLEYPKPPSPELAKEIVAEGKLVKPVIEETIQKQVVDAAKEAVKILPPDEKKRIGQYIIDQVASGEFGFGEIPNILTKHGISAEEFAIRLKDTYSTAGRSLQRLSVVARQAQKLLKDNPEASNFLNKFIGQLPQPSKWDKFMTFAYNVESTRRGFLVTQLATAVRNAISQQGRITLAGIDEAFQGIIRSSVGGKGNILKEMGEGLDVAIATINRMRPETRKRLAQILESDNASLAKTKLLSTSVHEVHIGNKISGFLNTFNRLQEYYFRKIAFEAKLTQLLERAGMDIKNINPSKIPEEMLTEAAQYGLDMTFAAMPKSKMAANIVRQWSGNPLMTALFNPFPRFAFGNALPFIVNHSPISLMKALNPKIVAQLASGNPEKFAELGAKGIEGTVMLGLANWIRNSKVGGEKWYEIKWGDKTIDTRAFAPFNTYLLIGEAISHPEKLDISDLAQAAIGLNRIAGTGLIVTDIIREKKLEHAMDIFKRFAGEYLGSFSVPARTFQDIYSSIEPQSTYYRDVRDTPITGPLLRNIPIASETLPEMISPVKREIPKVEYPVLKQFTGLSLKTKTLIEKEIDKLAIDTSRIYPRTGIPEGDRELSRKMGPIIEKVTPKILDNPNYKKFSEAKKRVIITELFKEAKKEARQKLAIENPKLFLQIRSEGIKEDIKEILEERGILIK